MGEHQLENVSLFNCLNDSKKPYGGEGVANLEIQHNLPVFLFTR